MKKLIITFAAMLLTMGAAAQGYTRQGNTFKATTTHKASTATRDTIVTAFKYQTTDGTSHPIIVNKQSGACYIWRTSKKSGKPYKMYLKAEIKAAIAKELKLNVK